MERSFELLAVMRRNAGRLAKLEALAAAADAAAADEGESDRDALQALLGQRPLGETDSPRPGGGGTGPRASAAEQSLSRSSKDAVPSGPVPPAGSDTRRQWVLKTLVRRGAALARQGELPGAIEDYETALAISPLDAALQRDLDQLRAEQSQKREQGEQPLPSE